MRVFEVIRGASPVILGIPHTGTDVPAGVWDRLNEHGRRLADTDWHIHELYAGLLDDSTAVRATFHRYVIDANRDPSGVSLYPGQNTTGLIPQTDFDGKAIWKEGSGPTDEDLASRLEAYHAPYHAALKAEINRIVSIHGVAILYDCHSIRSRVPFLFEGTLPDFNIGSDDGKTCDPAIEKIVVNVTRAASGYTSVLNGRFKGGWTTRHYGRPKTGVHAIQMELAQSSHLVAETSPFAYDEKKADRLRVHLKEILTCLERVATEIKS